MAACIPEGKVDAKTKDAELRIPGHAVRAVKDIVQLVMIWTTKLSYLKVRFLKDDLALKPVGGIMQITGSGHLQYYLSLLVDRCLTSLRTFISHCCLASKCYESG